MAMSQSGKVGIGLFLAEPALSLWPKFPACLAAFFVALFLGMGDAEVWMHSMGNSHIQKRLCSGGTQLSTGF